MRGIQPPEVTEIGSYGFGIAANENTRHDQACQRRNLGDSKYVLNGCAGAYAENIYKRQQNDDHNTRQVLGVQTDIHIAQHHRSDVPWRHMADMPDPVIS